MIAKGVRGTLTVPNLASIPCYIGILKGLLVRCGLWVNYEVFAIIRQLLDEFISDLSPRCRLQWLLSDNKVDATHG